MIKPQDSCEDLSDNEIVKKSLEDLDYFSCLYKRFEPELLRYIQRMTGITAEEAQDILQESFIKIWRNLKKFDQDLKLSSWIYRIVHNEVVSSIRRNKSYGKNKTIDIKNCEHLITDDNKPDSEDEEEEQILLYETLNLVPIKYREVLILKFLEKKSYEEISDILKIPEGTVAIRINRAKQKFRDLASFKKYFQ
ncbi:MAG: RNA polymerase sigma factor [Bacteroidales bacterium]|nr:RNA polymerase sigma factor [Bacteroidales bacterium]MCF8455944.1 RNA polymerase sigma factor [Bacteroidales bacterium]